MLVKWNATRTLGFPLKSGEELMLIPGVNDISDESWKEMKEHPGIKLKIENDELEEIKSSGKGGSSVGSFLRMKDKDAAKLAKETNDKGLLENWNAQEKRPMVKKAIKAQLDELANVEFRDENKSNEELPPANDE